MALSVGVFAQSTRVGGSGTTRVGGSGTTRVTAPVAAGITLTNNWKNKTSSGTSVAVTVAPTSGKDVIVAWVISTASATVTDNLGSTYTPTATYAVFGITLGYAITNNVGSGLTTVTVTPNASGAVQAFVFECDGVSTHTGGETATNFGAGTTTWSSGTVTTATADSIIFFVAAGGTGNNSTTFSNYTNSFARANIGTDSFYGTGASDFAASVSYRIVSSAAGYSTATDSSVAANWPALIAAFR